MNQQELQKLRAEAYLRYMDAIRNHQSSLRDYGNQKSMDEARINHNKAKSEIVDVVVDEFEGMSIDEIKAIIDPPPPYRGELIILNIDRFDFFKRPEKLQELNEIVELHTILTAGVVSSATGCSIRLAEDLLSTIYDNGHGFLQKFNRYYIKETGDSIMVRAEHKGHPELPIITNEQWRNLDITSLDQLYWESEYKRLKDFWFMWKKAQSD